MTAALLVAPYMLFAIPVAFLQRALLLRFAGKHESTSPNAK